MIKCNNLNKKFEQIKTNLFLTLKKLTAAVMQHDDKQLINNDL